MMVEEEEMSLCQVRLPSVKSPLRTQFWSAFDLGEL